MTDNDPEELQAKVERLAVAAAEQARIEAEDERGRIEAEQADEAERRLEVGLGVHDPEPAPATDRLRAFEDAEFGPDAVRIGGKIERGYGSPFKSMGTEKQRQYAALEKLIVTEQKLADAHAALIQADVEHDAALADAKPKPDGKGPTVEEWVAAGYRAINYPPHGYESRSTREEIDAAIAKQKPDAPSE